MNEKELDPTASPEAAFGYELRKRRKEAGLTLDQVAKIVNVSRPTVGAYEQGTRGVTEAMASRLEGALGLEPGQLVDKLPAGKKSSILKSLLTWIEFEKLASKLWTWQPTIVPGLLQTADYAEALIRGKPGVTDSQVREAVKARMDRQKIFLRDNPTRLWAILDESILYRPVGSVDITRDQLARLVDVGRSPWATIQILPYSAMSTPGVLGGWTIAHANGRPEAAYVDSPLRGQLSDHPSDVEILRLRYETAREESLPASQSIKMIEERLGQAWTFN